jgi:hypothetical protein
MGHQELVLLVEECRYSQDIDRQFDLLREINNLLPASERVHMPSLVTDDYCRRALEIIEDRIARVVKASGREFNWP